MADTLSSKMLDTLHQRLSGAQLQSSAPDIEAVVGVLLVEMSAELDVLLVQRAVRFDDPWSGHIGFPGGRIKPTDGSAVEGCEREVSEEVGVDLAREAVLLGGLSPAFPSNRPQLKVQPWVFGLRVRPSIALGPEIAAAFWIPLQRLPKLRKQSRVATRVGERLVDSFVVDGRVVWGFTYRVLEELLRMTSTG